MPAPTSQSRRSSSSHSRHSSSGAGAGAFEPETHSTDADYDFCNAYWVTAGRRPRGGSTKEGDEEDWGKEGYETVMTRMKMGTKALEELKQFYKDRASMEDDYAKKLNRLSRHPFGTGEIGHLDRAILQTKAETDAMGKSHTDLANLMRSQEAHVGDFLTKRENSRKSQQTNIEKLWKNLGMQRSYVLKAKAKYEEDAISINALHAQATLLQGRDLDKASMKLDKVQQTVVVNERDYRNYVNVLKETTANWNMAWKAFCDLCQDQEEERLEFVKGRLWDWANALSTVAMAEDESAERTRTALEQCEPKTDIRIFVQQTGTGNSIPDPLPFVDFKLGGAQPKQRYQLARFTRSSARIPGVKHSPSAVDDIARAFHNQSLISQPQSPATPAQTSSQPQRPQPAQETDASRSRVAEDVYRDQHGIPAAASSQSIGRPPPRDAYLSSQSLAADMSNVPPSQETTPTRSKAQEATASPSRFAVSPSAHMRGASDRPPSQVGTPSSKPGHVSASAFQRRSVSPRPAEEPSVQPYTAPIPQAQSTTASKIPAARNEAEDEDDPLLRALNVLKSTPSPQPPRSDWSSKPAASQSGGVSSQRSSTDLRSSTNRQSQQSLGRSTGPGYTSSSSRPASPAPQAPYMQAPMQQGAYPRPTSRQGSTVSSISNRYSTGPHETARARSPSPSPYHQQHPEALRPHSPAPHPQRSASPQPARPQSGSGYARPPSQQQQQYPQQAQHKPGSQSQQQGTVPPSQQYSTSYSSQQIHQRQPSFSASSSAVGLSSAPSQQLGRPASPNPSRQLSQSNEYARVASPNPLSPQSYAPSPQQQQQGPAHTSRTVSQSQSQQFSPHPAHANASLPHQSQIASPYTSASPYTAFSASPYVQQQSPHPHQAYQSPSIAPSPYTNVPTQAANNVVRSSSIHSGVSNVSKYSQPSPYPQQGFVVQPQQPSPFQNLPQHQAPLQPQQMYQHPQQAQQPQQWVQHQPQQATQQQQQQPVQQIQQQSQPQQAHQRTTSAASMRAGPPTGQWTDDGRPILFYVNAIYDYQATSAEEFSFSAGDVIAVTDTDPDGWWQGNKVGVTGGGRLFPSNFTELLP